RIQSRTKEAHQGRYQHLAL
ncbi:hypothetical protein MPH_14232, partial [Macrophomina phaseolina MS6]